jgi:hypothetical protein
MGGAGNIGMGESVTSGVPSPKNYPFIKDNYLLSCPP